MSEAKLLPNWLLALEHIRRVEDERHAHFMRVLEYVIENQELPPQGGVGTVLVPRLNVRSGPGISHPDIGDLKEGAVVQILEERSSGDDIWACIWEGQWAAVRFQGKEYIKIQKEGK